MSADEMFEKLGYTKKGNGAYIEYTKKDKKTSNV